MEFIEGRSLLQCVPPGGMPEETAKNYFYQIALAVSYCHAHDVRTSPLDSLDGLHSLTAVSAGDSRGP